MSEMLSTANEAEFRYFPFNLTQTGSVPVKVVKEMINDGYVILMLTEVPEAQV